VKPRPRFTTIVAFAAFSSGLGCGGGTGGPGAQGGGGAGGGAGNAAAGNRGSFAGNAGSGGSGAAGAGGSSAGAGGFAAGAGGSPAGAAGSVAGAAGSTAGAGGSMAGAAGSIAGAGGSTAGAGGSAAGAAGSTAGAGGSAGGGAAGTGSGGGAAGSGLGGFGGQTCFPAATGVPGQSGLPNWWLGSAPFDDPRWAGSFGYSFGPASLNALLETEGADRYLVLRWNVTYDPGAALPGDQVWVGFYNPAGGGTGTIFQLTRDTTTTTTAGLAGPGIMSVSAFSRAGSATIWTSATVPGAVSTEARIDASCVGMASFPNSCPSWAIRLRVPMSAANGGVDLGNTFSMWSEIDVDHGDVVGTGVITTDSWPAGASGQAAAGFPPIFPEPLGSVSPPSAAWSLVDASGGSCVAGIALQSGDITVVNTIGAGTTIDVASANTFHVRPLNETTATWAGNAIGASLRIADWGTGIGDSPLWLAVPDASCAGATGSGVVPAGSRFDLACNWTLTTGQRCDYRPDLAPGCTPDSIGARFAQQAIFVELTSSGIPITFPSSSAATTFSFGTH
jgi:hypothetical protein